MFRYLIAVEANTLFSSLSFRDGRKGGVKPGVTDNVFIAEKRESST